ncbi:hypothetical protein B0H10DRAFT_681835 [Mycena sp. CBHHK59/15]|nr:hypothetical protein B0H10DRAFT_681835 [Mycena sp. CBHHK59/15]
MKLEWPSEGREEKYYVPFCAFLNAICAEYTALGLVPSHHKDLVFSVYDRTITEGVDSAAALKPDLLGCNRSIPTGVSWTEPEGALEVKNLWPKMTSQAATHGRSYGRSPQSVLRLGHPSKS